MLKCRDGLSIYMSLEPMDMRKAINGLVVWVSQELNRAVQTGDLFVFLNKARDRVKILFWDRNGFVLYHKRLEKHKFKLPKQNEIQGDVLTLTPMELQGLLAGLDILLMREFKEICYEEFI